VVVVERDTRFVTDASPELLLVTMRDSLLVVVVHVSACAAVAARTSPRQSKTLMMPPPRTRNVHDKRKRSEAIQRAT
jgi:hypothetical protein